MNPTVLARPYPNMRAVWTGRGVHTQRPSVSLEALTPLLERELDRLCVGVVSVHRRVPDPDIQPVFVSDARDLGHHPQRREWEERAIGEVVGPRRDQFDGVAPEDGEVAD